MLRPSSVTLNYAITMPKEAGLEGIPSARRCPPGDRAGVASKTLDRRRDGCLIALIRSGVLLEISRTARARVDCGQLPYSPYFQQVSGPQQQPTPTWVGGPMLSTKLASIATSCDECLLGGPRLWLQQALRRLCRHHSSVRG